MKREDFKELYKIISLETKDEEIFKKQTETISKIIKEMQDSFKEVYTVGEKVLISMANELKDEYKI